MTTALAKISTRARFVYFVAMLSLFLGTVTATSAQASPTVQPAGQAISRSTILARAKTWVDAKVPYSELPPYYEGYRRDCSGFVSMAWDLSGPGRQTWTLPDVSTRLASTSQLRPGDILDIPHQHVMLFVGWSATDRGRHRYFDLYEEPHPGQVAEARRNVDILDRYNRNFVPYRYNNVVEGGPAGPAGPAMAYDKGDGTMAIYRWTSTGSAFSGPAVVDSGSFGLGAVAGRMSSGDVNGDGKADIVMAYQNGDGTFSLHVWSAGTTYAGRWYTSGPFSLDRVGDRFVVGDFTGDGKADVAMAYDKGDGTMAIYRWTSTGSAFSGPAVVDSGSFGLGAVAGRMSSGDVNGDGKADIVMAYQNGDGTFSLHVWSAGTTYAGRWYTSGPFSLDRVGDRFTLGAW